MNMNMKMIVLMLTNMFSDFEICLSCSGSRATFGQQDNCFLWDPGQSARRNLGPEQTSRSRHHNKYLLWFRDLFILFWDRNKTSRSWAICLSCSGTRTRQADPRMITHFCVRLRDLLVLFWDQNKTRRCWNEGNKFLWFRDLLVLFWDQNKTSRSWAIWLPCSGTRTKQSDPGTTKHFFAISRSAYKQIAGDLLFSFWSQNRPSRLPGICLSCSGPGTKPAGFQSQRTEKSGSLVLGPEQDKQIARDLLVLFWPQNKTSRLPGICLSFSGLKTRRQANLKSQKKHIWNLLVLFWSQNETSTC